MLPNVTRWGTKTPRVEKHYQECKCQFPFGLLGELNKKTMGIQIPNHWIHTYLSCTSPTPSLVRFTAAVSALAGAGLSPDQPLLFTCSHLGLGRFCGGLQGDRRSRKAKGAEVRPGGPSQACHLLAVKRLAKSLGRSQFPRNVV